jgi:redox-sensitive bicupin YhaK (pirin superfamily)
MHALTGRTRDLGSGFIVSRVLPDIKFRSVGPFVFFDYFGPVDMLPGVGIDVRPHPHIGLATVTYLFEGSQVHRDSIGSVQTIMPGDVNWMTAGRFIVHSERTGPEVRADGHRLHGIQSWIGLPQADEECDPDFQHVGARDLPTSEEHGVRLRLVTGRAFGLASPVRVFSEIFYADAEFAAGARLSMTNEHRERAVFVVGGELDLNGVAHAPGTMIVLDPSEDATIVARDSARAMLLGGAALDGPRHLWWNFVSSSQERIERAKKEWSDNPRGHIPGDPEFIPLPAPPPIVTPSH